MKNIPNILSTFRIFLIPFFVWQMLKGNTTNAGLILVLSGFTDFLDGNLARKFNWITDLGKILDPIADKLTQAAISITMIISIKKYQYFFIIMILKDLIMLVLGGYLMKNGIKLEGAKWFGKISTFVYYAVMILLLFIPNMPNFIVVSLLFIATVTAIISAVLYIPEYINKQKEIYSKNKKM
ncbi:CDP-alcohol phosphatidyltransferase family protein [Miniphocaeibacter halophilus]|uniref:CDP-alcohol phosphatidyltransferase family protein n=1 Tax=Miniphocaeibacter halophilus TaxID=2931922 RepID=A0AC61N104_9FIRM|nr:CDP-alcohol phosphatidyltransferase family protein [Miniphocaeibacter halophilus]QQK08658.1 CDP-alcohol phosphatidyltransferase family protein [Miniphocaeibacter halophilus]